MPTTMPNRVASSSFESSSIGKGDGQLGPAQFLWCYGRRFWP